MNQNETTVLFEQGKIYFDMREKRFVEFGYLGQTGLAIVYSPGDSGGGMQSSWGVKPSRLEEVVDYAEVYKKYPFLAAEARND